MPNVASRVAQRDWDKEGDALRHKTDLKGNAKPNKGTATKD
jgi:hypothetical protein